MSPDTGPLIATPDKLSAPSGVFDQQVGVVRPGRRGVQLWRRKMSDFDLAKMKRRVEICESVWKSELVKCVAEIERLRSDKQYAENFDLHSEIDSLTKERDELKLSYAELVRVIRMQRDDKDKLEAENSELKKKQKARFSTHEETLRKNVGLGRQIESLTTQLAVAEKTMATRLARVEELYEKLTTSEKENAKLKEQLSEMEKNLQRNELGEWKK